MAQIPARTFRGTRDFLPPELLARRRIVQIIEEAYRRYGFQPLETPAIEYLEILTGKSEENDKLIYEIKRARGGEEETAESAIALRYDLTVPLARVVAQYAELPRPFKRYQIQPVWRADRPQPRQGRFREFVQCDADIVGTESLLADAEIIALTYEVLRDLGFENFKIRLSSRKFLQGLTEVVTGDASQSPILIRIIDKLDKIGMDGVATELEKSGFNPSAVLPVLQQIAQLSSGAPDSILAEDSFHNAILTAGVKEVQEIYIAALNLNVPANVLVFDPFLARGLDYYTGPIFESVCTDLPHLGSLSGGGRYDGLVSTFTKERVPAVGTTLGLDRIQTALTQLNKFAAETSTTHVLIARFDSEGMADYLKMAAELRAAGINTEVWYDDDRMKKQFAYADRQGIPLVIIAGSKERESNKVAVKNMKTTEQVEISRDKLVEFISGAISS